MEPLASHKIVRSLGVGATSEVFEALRLQDDKRVALKRFSAFVASEPEMRERLRLEVDVLGKLNHPNIVGLLGTVETDSSFALELELVEGASLAVWSAGYKCPLLEPKLWILAEVTRALGAAHENQILHRDIKPENILVANSGDVKLTDFGLARSLSRVTVTKSGVLIGSLAYMAPEIIDMADATEKSDVFSFGVIAYELLANARPYPGESPQAIIRQIAEGKVRPLREANPLIPSSTAALIHACLETQPANRPRSIWHIHADLMAQLQSSGMLPYCRALASRAPGAVLVEALQKKRARLTARLEALKAAPKSGSLGEQLEILGEMKRLFPNDAAVDGLLEAAVAQHSQSPARSRGKKIGFALLVLLFGVAVSAYLQHVRSQRGESPARTEATAATAVAVPENSGPPAEVPLAAQPAVAETPVEAAAERPVPTDGFIRFALSREIDVYVDDNFVPAERRGRYQVSAGTHEIRMEMKGYLPIHNRIEVKPGKVATVRAGGKE